MTKSSTMGKGKRPASPSNPQRKKKPNPGEQRKEKTKASEPSRDEIFEKLMGMKFDQTKFVDVGMLEKLGIHGDVMLLFENMGLDKFMGMQEPAQQDITCEFLSSLTAWFYEKDCPVTGDKFEKYGRGVLRFTVREKNFTVTFGELCEIFGFEEEATSVDHRFRYPIGELQRLWKTIASGRFEPGASKVALIRNPAIRYAYKALMHVFYAKIEVDTMTNEGLEFIGTGLTPLLENHRDGGEFYGPEQIPCLATLLSRSLLDYKEWAWKTKAKKAYIGMGWIVTALLKAKARQVRQVSLALSELPLMDEQYLHKARFVKKHENGFAYTFHPTTATTAQILLPQPQLTRLETLENVIFDPPHEFHLGHVEEEYPEPPRGASRYDFAPYDGPMNTAAACSKAHERINLLQRMVKWQNRTIEKMAKTMRGMKKTIKELSCTKDSTTRMETSGEGGSQRTSSKAKGKQRAQTPSPTSSNESLALDTESSASPSPTPSP